MRVSVTEAKQRLTELVRRAEAVDEVVLTRHGRAAVKPAPVRRRPDADARRAVTARMRAAAARSQDFLHRGDGLPQGSRAAPPG